MATQQEVFDIVKLMEPLPNSPLKDASKERIAQIVQMFFVTLKDIPNQQLQAAAIHYISEGIFFPMPGVLREKAMDLMLLSQGIPTPAEAWAQVQKARQYHQTIVCEEADRLRNAYLNEGQKQGQLRAYDAHLDTCAYCKPGGFRDVYGHEVVRRTVETLGGREALLTENPVSDRARFIEAYREILGREKTIAGMIPEVRTYVEEKAQMLAEEHAAMFDTGEKKSIDMQARLLARFTHE